MYTIKRTNMKNLITLVIILISVGCFAQTSSTSSEQLLREELIYKKQEREANKEMYAIQAETQRRLDELNDGLRAIKEEYRKPIFEIRMAKASCTGDKWDKLHAEQQRLSEECLKKQNDFMDAYKLKYK